MVTDVKPEQSKKALSPILVTIYSSSFIKMDEGISILPEYEGLLLGAYETSAILNVLST